MSLNSPKYPWWQMWRRSVVLRSALMTMVVAMVTTAIALTVQYRQSTSFIEKELHNSIESDMSVFLSEFGQNGRAGLIRLLVEVGNSPDYDDGFYLLTDRNGTVLAGNLKASPPQLNQSGWSHIQLSPEYIGGKQSRWIEANKLYLTGGDQLLLGRPADSLASFRARYLNDMAWALLVTAITGLLLGWLANRRVFNFIGHYAEATRRFHAGDLAARIPLSGREDEFDQLGGLINQATDMTERTNATLRAASDSLAHDLKTPLTAMRGRLELGLRKSDPQEILHEPAVQCITDIDTLLAQINAMLQLVRAESVTDAQFQPINLAAIVTDICETYEPVADDKGIDIAFHVLLVTVSGMKPLLAQAIANLLDNAIKYTPHGGSIDVSMLRQDKNVQIIVADNGPGIADADKQRAVDRYVRLDASRTTTGSGLGLHYVATVARVHHGNLVLENNAPGLRAVISLPLGEIFFTPL